MQSSTQDESEEEYEEYEDFDGEYSVFGSERVVEKTNNVLGKRQRGDEND